MHHIPHYSNKLKKALYILSFLFASQNLLAQIGQETQIDSLLQVIEKSESSSEKFKAHLKISDIQRNINPMEVVRHAELAHALIDLSAYPGYKAKAKVNWAIGLAQTGRIDTALTLWLEAKSIYEYLNNEEKVQQVNANLGLAYNYKGDFEKAMPLLVESLKYFEKKNDLVRIASGNLNLGLVQWKMGNHDQALDSYKKSLHYYNEANMPLNGNVYVNIGIIYGEKKMSDSALYYFHSALFIARNNSDSLMISNLHNNIAEVHLSEPFVNSLDSAIYHYNKGQEIQIKLNDYRGLIYSNKGLGYAKMKEGKYEQAKEYMYKSLELAKAMNMFVEISQVYEGLYEVNLEQGNDSEALRYHLKYIEARDSIFGMERQMQFADIMAEYEDEKKQLKFEALEKENIQEAKLAKELDKKKNIIIVSISCGLILLIVFLGFLFNRFRITTKQKNLITEQKKAVDDAYSQLALKNKEVLDSINYAKRIQMAILPAKKVLKDHLPEHFILYKPKDIVAGDFYWLEHKEDKVLFAVCDCTGHGVPGAMVSVICNNGLNRSVREHRLTDPGEILDKTREIVIQEFEKSEEEVRDGMDVALCSLEGHKLSYAGANNPIWIIRKGAHEIEEIKADKQPIGKFSKPKPHTTHSLNLEAGDSLYIFSDGFADQFGGEKGKKFKTAKFKSLLLSIQSKSMEKQRDFINEVFENWRGPHEQLDDVCVIGVRI